MKKLKIEIIFEEYKEDFNDKVNKFLSKLDKGKVVDIKFCTDFSKWGRDSKDGKGYFNAMIIYEA